MLCKKPLRNGTNEYGCGQCTPCRVNRRHDWTKRLQAELEGHDYAAFVTLTYAQETIPKDFSLKKRHIQLFLKKLRKAISPRQIRFYCCGEYGEKTRRPHYHLILFGISPTEGPLLQKVWNQGHVHVGTAEQGSIRYTANYVTKKLFKHQLQGKEPEFIQMSRRPGIGYAAVERIVRGYQTLTGKKYLERHGWPEMAIPKYIREKVVEKLELTEEQRRIHHVKLMAQSAARVWHLSAEEEDKRRKSKISAQSSRYKNERDTL